MVENKTRATAASVAKYVAAIADESQRNDCNALIELMSRVTNEKPTLWGTSIVGFGSYHYRYASGREGDACLTGFAARKGQIAIYLMVGDSKQSALLSRLGKHKMGKACLAIRRLSEIDTQVLERLVANSVAAIKRRYPEPALP